MSIGEALTRARNEVGLSVADVSRRTRIRETIISGIERDDFALCGGDFYARGHIRAIARVIGIDSEPLIEEYDAAYLPPDTIPGVHRPPDPNPGAHPPPEATPGTYRPPDTIPGTHRPIETIPEPGADEPVTPQEQITPQEHVTPQEPVEPPEPVRPQEPSPWREPVTPQEPVRPQELVTPQQPGPWREPARPYEPVHPPMPGAPVTPAGWITPEERAAPGAHRRRRVNWSAVLGLALLVVLAGGGYLLASGGQTQHETSAASNHRTTGHPGARPWPSRAAPSPTRTHSAAPAQALNPVNISAFGPSGPGEGDNPQLASFALDDNAATPWHSDWYTTPQFGNLQPGTGLLLDMGRTITLTGAQIAVGNGTGGDIQLRVGGTPALGNLPPVADGTDVGGTVRLRPAAPSQGRYVLVWFTKLPQDQAGTFQASVYSIKLQGST